MTPALDSSLFGMQPSDIEALISATNQAAIVSITDVRGTITYVNDLFVQISGYSREELLGQNHRILKSGDQPQSLFEDLWHTISRGKIWQGEIKNRTKSGEYYWVRTTITPVKNAKGVIERYVGVRFLITDQKASEETAIEQREAMLNVLEDMQESEQLLRRQMRESRKFQSAVEASSDAILITDASGKILYVNPSWVRLTGYAPEEAIGQTPRMLKSGQTDRAMYDTLWRTIRSGETFTTEGLVNRRKDGSLFYADITIYPITENGQTIYFVGAQRDITQRKKEERIKAEFVSIASHQLRTPLTGIRWSIGRLRKLGASLLPAPLLELLDSASAAVRRMGETINAMLAMSRIESGKLKVSHAPVAIKPLLDEMAIALRAQIQHGGVHYLAEYPPDLTIDTDQTFLREILDNLLSNALKYTPRGGTVRLTLSADHETVTLKVADTGYGIPPDQQDKVFTKFFRADNILSKEPDGNGLGLYLTASLVQLLGGTIHFTSVLNKGTTFVITLPLHFPTLP